MNTPIAVRIECAKGEILNAMETIQTKHALPPCIMDGVLSSVLAEVRSEAKIELINSTNAMMAEKDEELEKAKKAAKRTLRTEPEELSLIHICAGGGIGKLFNNILRNAKE